MTNTAHTTSIHTTAWTDKTGTTSRYSVKCSICGNVGQTQEYEADAQAIAVRHREVGGFERAPSEPNPDRCAVCGGLNPGDITHTRC